LQFILIKINILNKTMEYSMSSPVWFSPIYSSKAQETKKWFGTSFKDVVDYPEYKKIEETYPRTDAQQQRYMQILSKKNIFNDNYLDFQPIPKENAPTMMYGEGLRKDLHQFLPGFFQTLDSLVVTKECLDLLMHFNLGERIQFFPVPLYDLEKNELVNHETYYVMSVADWRSFLTPEFCQGELSRVRRLDPEKPRYSLDPGDEFDEAIALSSEASNCDLDLWHDPALKNSLFMSDRLKQALEQAGFLANFHICATKLVHKQ